MTKKTNDSRADQGFRKGGSYLRDADGIDTLQERTTELPGTRKIVAKPKTTKPAKEV